MSPHHVRPATKRSDSLPHIRCLLVVVMKYKGLVDPEDKPFGNVLPFEVQVKIMFWVGCFYTMDKRKKVVQEFKGLPKCDLTGLPQHLRRHASSSPCPSETRRTQVPMWVRSQDEIESYGQELQQSVFQLWELCPWERTLWLLSMAPWPLVVSPRASATYPETMGERHTP